MTCIAALIDRKRTIYMGGDSALSDETSVDIITRKKILRRGPVLIGWTGSPWLMNILHHKFRAPGLDGYDPDKYISGPFIDTLRRTCRQNGHKSIHTGDHEGELLVGLRGRFFVVQEDLSAYEIERKYAAIGSGADFALGVLYRGIRDQRPGREVVREALKFSATHHPNVRGRFTVLSLGVNQ